MHVFAIGADGLSNELVDERNGVEGKVADLPVSFQVQEVGSNQLIGPELLIIRPQALYGLWHKYEGFFTFHA